MKDEVTAIFNAALFLALQADGGEAPVSGSSTHITGALWDLVNNIGPIALFVLAVLLFASLYSWTVIFGKMGTFGRATSESRRFVRAFRKAQRLQEISALAETYKASPLAQVFVDVFETYVRQTGGSGRPRNITALERSAQTAASESITHLERRMTWLATIAATSPFVGLFGTVMGVVDAFHGLGTAGAATLRAVAPGISEALITTAAGLFVAVPAVVAYNQFTARIRVLASATDDFCRELLNSLEEIPERGQGATQGRGAAVEPAEELPRGSYKY